MLFPFSAQSLPETSSKGQLIPRQHPCLAATSLHSRLMQCRYNGVAQSTRRTYQSGLNAYFSFCTRFNIITVPASSLTLQYFCVDKSHLVSYKTLKVYLAAIRLMHIENGFPDPTTDESLHLVCRGIRCQQSGSECTRLPITINLLRTLKFQLRSSNKSLLDQRLLWAAFTVLFYGFLRASECLSLTWSDVLIHDDHITITLQQSKTDPFRRGQSIKVYSSLTTTCPVKALTNYANSIAAKQPHHFVFSAGTFLPLSRSKLTAEVRQLLSQAGMSPSDYASHSFRIGAATMAAAAGLPPYLIKTLGRWNSNAYMSYVRCPQSIIATTSQQLSTASVPPCTSWNPDLH